jgi:predicted dehydrogenase
MFKAAIVGCGGIGAHHARCYADTREVALGAVMDVVPEKAEKLAREHNVPYLTDLRAVLAREDIDFIDVCVPSGTHGDVLIAAAKAGKHCITEKPMDVTPQRCDQILAAFKKSRTTLGGIFQHRYADDTRRTKEAVDAGRFGRLTLLLCSTPWWRTQEYYDSGDWRGTWKLDGGGALMNQGIHAIDLMVWFGGPVLEVTARTALLAHKRVEVEDAAVATVQFQSGALGVVMGTTAAYPGTSVRHEVMGTDGMVILADDKATLWRLRDEEGREKPAEAAETKKAGASAAADPRALTDAIFVRNIDDVARAARTGKTPLVSGEQHRKAVEVICAIYKSAQTGRPVRLPLKRFAPKPSAPRTRK